MSMFRHTCIFMILVIKSNGKKKAWPKPAAAAKTKNEKVSQTET